MNLTPLEIIFLAIAIHTAILAVFLAWIWRSGHFKNLEQQAARLLFDDPPAATERAARSPIPNKEVE